MQWWEWLRGGVTELMTAPEWPIGFARPMWLLALLFLPWMWRAQRRGFAIVTPGRARLSRWLRTIVFTCLVFALAGIRVTSLSDDLTVIFLLDKSESTRDPLPQALSDLDIAVETMTPRDTAGMVVFGADSYVENAPEPKPSLKQIATVIDAAGTDISRAIRLGLGLFPENRLRRLVLLSDGNENLGDALEEAKAAAAAGIPIDIIPLKPRSHEEVLVEEVGIPETMDKDEPFELKITVRSTLETGGTLRLFQNDKLIGTREVELSPGKNVFTMQEKATREGFQTYSVLLDSPADTMRANNESAAYTRVFGQPNVLLVGPEEDRAYLARALATENWKVEESENLPGRLVQAENYDAIVMANAPSEWFSNSQLSMVQDYVRDLGGGFLMIGGENSFALGGFAKTPVEEALPVHLELKNKRMFPSLALAIVVDKSGSMGERLGLGGVGVTGADKMMLANQATVSAIELLTDQDYAMVIGFDGDPKTVVPLGPIGGNRNRIYEDVLALRPGGGTDMYPAMKAAFDELRGVQAQLKHMILVTDGMTQPGAFPELAAECVAEKITISSIAIGLSADVQLLQTLATLGEGRFYQTDDPGKIPRIFTKETYIAQRAYLIEEDFTPTIFQENQIIKGLESFPVVKGYIVTEPKDRAELVLLSHKGEPLLATWRYGLGKSVAFTSDAKARWLTNWVRWDGYNPFFAQMVRWALRNDNASELHPRLEIERGKGKLIVDAVDDRDKFLNDLELQARVTPPESAEGPRGQDVRLVQTGPGRYEAEFDARAQGPYLVRVFEDKEGSAVNPATTGAVVPYPPEYRDLTANELLLNQIASRSGGRYNPPITELFTREQQEVRTYRDLWFWFMMIAICLFPLDIASRRIYLDDEQLVAIRKKLTGWMPRPAPRLATAGAPATIEALKQVRKVGPVQPGVTTTTATASVFQEAMNNADAPQGSVAMAAEVQAAAELPPDPALGATLDRLKKVTRDSSPKSATTPEKLPAGSTESAPKPAFKPLIIPSAAPPPQQQAPDEDAGLSPMERLKRARDRSRKQ